MAQTINVPGIGALQFPDGMSDQDMATAIQKNFPQIHPHADPIGEANAAENARPHPSPVADAGNMMLAGVKGVPDALKGMASQAGGMVVDPYGTMGHTIAHAFRTAMTALSDPSATISSIGATLKSATPEQVGTNVIAPALASAGVGGAASLAGRLAGGSAAVEGPLGMRTGADSGIARTLAGDSARPTVTAHNQAIADPALGAQAGVPIGTKVSPQSLDEARKPAESVYERTKASIPTGPLSPNAAQAVQGVGADDMIVRSPDVQATIDAQKARLLSGNLTGPQVVDAQRALRFNGFRNMGSEDPEMNALGHAQLKMSDALHQHMVDSLPENAPVTADQLAQARVALAQNHTVENALGPNGNVSLTKLAKFHNDNPNVLTGPMRDIAQFASDHPEVTALPSAGERFNPSGFGKDLHAVDIKSPISITQPFVGSLARRALRGGATPVPDVPVTGLGGEFGPMAPQPLELQPPPGTALEPHQHELATGMSEKDLAELIKKRKRLGELF